MTPKQKKHEEEYLAAKKKYENAYMEKAKYERELANLAGSHNDKIKEINSNKAKRKKLNKTYKEIEKVSGKDGSISKKFKDADKKMNDAATHFKGIGETNLGKQKDLETVFSERNTKSKSNIKKAFLEIKGAKKSLDGQIEELSRNIRKLEQEVETNKSKKRTYENNIANAKSTMSKMAVEMAYHKKQMMIP